ncbi:MAG TPA: hypothetical protein VK783_04630 [Bacteroidia bacterium]|jgi:hypothetical protein|nr:hypothetical protein [Bacteroidia bacterium]
MRNLLLLSILLFLVGCSDNTSKVKDLQSEINALNAQNDSLRKLVNTMKPGLGELMLDLQVHHNKLWFAGREENWPLAQFEFDEMMEIVHQAEAIETDRPEVKLFKPMLYTHLDSIQKAIKSRDVHEFTEKFYALTSACNSCHKNTHFEFNKIQTPEHPPYSNQDFSTDNN